MLNQKNKKPRLVFMGSADFSVPILIELIKNFDVLAVVTEIDKPVGRKKEVTPPPTKIIAQKNSIPCYQPLTVKKNPKFVAQIEELNPDVIVVAAYGKILPQEFLNIAEHGCVNVHPSLLPIYRGPSPIQTALLNGDTKTGISIMLLDKEMDAGDIIYQQEVSIDTNEKYLGLERKLALLSADILVRVLPQYLNNDLKLEVQNASKATFCHKITKQSGRIQWQQSATQIINQMRAYDGWPGVYTVFNGKKLDIIDAKYSFDEQNKIKAGTVYKKEKRIYVKCGADSIELVTVKMEGKKETPINNFVNGYQAFLDSVLE